MDCVTIRKAKREDCKEIMRLIRELAEFEKLPDQVNISYADLERDGFEKEHPKFGCYVAEIKKDDDALPSHKDKVAEKVGEQQTRLVGYALYYPTYSTWYGVSMFMEDLYVSPQYRGHGTGLALIKHVAKECLSLGCARLDFEVLDWNPARKYYEKLGAINRTEDGGWLCYRWTGEALQCLGNGDS